MSFSDFSRKIILAAVGMCVIFFAVRLSSAEASPVIDYFRAETVNIDPELWEGTSRLIDLYAEISSPDSVIAAIAVASGFQTLLYDDGTHGDFVTEDGIFNYISPLISEEGVYNLFVIYSGSEGFGIGTSQDNLLFHNLSLPVLNNVEGEQLEWNEVSGSEGYWVGIWDRMPDLENRGEGLIWQTEGILTSTAVSLPDIGLEGGEDYYWGVYAKGDSNYDGGSFQVSYFTVIPEMSSLLLLSIGIIGLLGIRGSKEKGL